MTPRQRRMTLVLGIVAGVGIAGALALSAFRSNVTFFFDPTAVAAGQVKTGEHFRLGGMVTKGSVKRTPGSLEVHFVVTDFKHDVPVTYTGVLPDLFREGTGVVAHGHMDGKGMFVADEVLAKHDEKYMPPEVAKSLKRRHGEAREEALSEDAPASASGAEAQSQGQGQSGAGPQGQSPPSTTSTDRPNAIGFSGPDMNRAVSHANHAVADVAAMNAGRTPSVGAASPRASGTQSRDAAGDGASTLASVRRVAVSSITAAQGAIEGGR